jgi:hypothetical protein
VQPNEIDEPRPLENSVVQILARSILVHEEQDIACEQTRDQNKAEIGFDEGEFCGRASTFASPEINFVESSQSYFAGDET